jgi:hypothetical protein
MSTETIANPTRKLFIPSSARHFATVFANSASKISFTRETMEDQNVVPPEISRLLVEAFNSLEQAQALILAEGDKNKSGNVSARAQAKEAREAQRKALAAANKAKREAKKNARAADRAKREEERKNKAAKSVPVEASPAATAAA